MLTAPDFEKKQIVTVFATDGDKICLQNGNLLVKDEKGNTKIQVSCFRLFLVFVIGHISITTPMIRESIKYGFGFALFSSGFHCYATMGAAKDGNTMLKRTQYAYTELDIGKHIIRNKIAMQYSILAARRDKNTDIRNAMGNLKSYFENVGAADNRNAIMAYEGLASKVYFKNHFDDMDWKGRQPRVKRDWINCALDIGYTILFSYMEALLTAYGFDIYIGVLHTEFYMRKSLVCDLVEPFRPIIDKTVRKCYNLHEMQEGDFAVVNHQYQLQWKQSPKYVRLFLEALLSEKMAMFLYVQQYYRCFMKRSDIEGYPFFYKGGITNGIDKL